GRAAAGEGEEEEVGVASEAGAEEEAAVAVAEEEAAVAVAVEAAEGADEDQHETRDPALPGVAARNGPRAGALPVPRGGGTRARGGHARQRSRAPGACPGPGERGDRLVGRPRGRRCGSQALRHRRRRADTDRAHPR